jgi:urease accessory protein
MTLAGFGEPRGRSLVTRAFASSPLRLLTPRNHGHAAWIYTATYGGGLVDGDAIRLDIAIGEEATALVATQAATKVYRSPGGTSVDVAATVGRGGLLVAVPDPVVCFADAVYCQAQHVELESTANLVLLDWFTCGRRAFGERWQFDRYESRVTIRRDGRLVLIDTLSLCRDDGSIASRMARFEAMATVMLTGPRLEPYAVRAVERIAQIPIARSADLLVGASSIDSGCIVRLAGTSVERVALAVKDVLQFVPALLGDDPWARKW